MLIARFNIYSYYILRENLKFQCHYFILSTAFMYGADSDTDEDIDLVQGGEDKLDDFDFYD